MLEKRPMDGVPRWPLEEALRWLGWWGQGDGSVPFTPLNYVKNFHVCIYHILTFSVLGGVKRDNAWGHFLPGIWSRLLGVGCRGVAHPPPPQRSPPQPPSG